MSEIEYIMNKDGKTKAIVIPIELWNRILPRETCSPDELSEAMEDYCMNNAMNEGKKSEILNRDEALNYL